MSGKAYTWHKIAPAIDALDFSGNNITVVECDGKKVCIGKFNDAYFGFAYKCPHAGGIMADGYIDPLGYVVCPLHRYKFNLQNGRNVSGEGYFLKHWPVEIREEGVFLAQEKGGLLSWLS